VTGQLFELIDTRNEKPITGGALGFDDRLEIFLSDPLKHLPVFDRCLKSNGVDLSELCSMRQTDVERLVTLTSGRGVAKTGVSLSDKSKDFLSFNFIFKT
jgi:hypothetical protein